MVTGDDLLEFLLRGLATGLLLTVECPVDVDEACALPGDTLSSVTTTT